MSKVQHKDQATIPTSVRHQAGQRSKIVITPEQRRIIDARLDMAAGEVRKGRVSPAFETIEQFAASLKADAKKLKGTTKRSADKSRLRA